jgi:hypothetical protein
MNFLCVKVIYNPVFCVCSILHCKFVYLFIFGLFHVLVSLWHTYGSMEYIYINSITNAITLPSISVCTLFRLLPYIAIGFVLDVDIFVVYF